MGACEPGQGRKSAAISGYLQVRRASHRIPAARDCASVSRNRTSPRVATQAGQHGSSSSRQNAEPNPNHPRLKPQASTSLWPAAIARRLFAELVGQEHVAKALANAIGSNRVGHAYLFTGARGVGKTSAARILAKALNCQAGPTPSPATVRHVPQRQRAAKTWTYWRSTGPATAASTRSASCGKTSTCGPAGRASRFTLSTKSTCSPARRSTPC